MYERRKVLEHFEAQKDFLKTTVPSNIEKYRQGDTRVTVTDRDGRPISGAVIDVKQLSHEFRFGANLFMLDELETEEKNETYKKRFAELFNMATLPFYWDTLEPERGKPRYGKDSPKIYRRPTPDLCIEFCQKHGIEPREHALAYDQFFPNWLSGASTDEVKAALENRFAEIAARYADKIPTIEVTNEMTWREGKTAFYDNPDYIEWCFRTARKHFPNNQLVINEGTTMIWGERSRCRPTDQYYSYIESNLLKGAPIDAIGMQYHLFLHKGKTEYEETRESLDPMRMYRTMDLYAKFGKPLQITEITLPAYSWKPEDEEIQAEMLETLYSVWFSHPAVEQIVYWNLVDGYAHLWDPSPEAIAASQGDMTLGENRYFGGLLRFDLSEKPAYRKLRELLLERWHTEATLVTDEHGRATFRGFYGDYSLSVQSEDQKTHVVYTLSKRNTKKDLCIEV